MVSSEASPEKLGDWREEVGIGVDREGRSTGGDGHL